MLPPISNNDITNNMKPTDTMKENNTMKEPALNVEVGIFMLSLGIFRSLKVKVSEII